MTDTKEDLPNQFHTQSNIWGSTKYKQNSLTSHVRPLATQFVFKCINPMISLLYLKIQFCLSHCMNSYDMTCNALYFAIRHTSITSLNTV